MLAECALYGYPPSGKFAGDICPQCELTDWRCPNSRYTVTVARSPAGLIPGLGIAS